jgi:RNA polymerase sigma-70 factor (ECF subfamily)
MTPRATEPDQLLEHAGFLRRLAIRLVRDEHDREDLVQHAFTAAFSDDARPRSVRAWLARTLRNQASNLRRDRRHREDRERTVARPESQADASGVDRALGVQEHVVTAVRELREPYKTTIYLRYYRDLAPAEIAALLGVPVATVNTRLLRGRAMLRESLTRELGHRDAWVSALLPLCPSGPLVPGGPFSEGAAGAGAAAPTSAGIGIVGALGMKLKIVIGVVALAAGVATFNWTRTGESVKPAVASAAPPAEQVAAVHDATPALAPNEPVRAVVAAEVPKAEVSAATEEAAPAVGLALSGIVLDLDGAPLAATRVRFVPGAGSPGAAPSTVTDPAGRFTLADLSSGGQVWTDEPELVTVIAGALEGLGGLEGDTTVVAAPARSLTVTVVDQAGDPLAGAGVEVAMPADLRTRFTQGFEQSSDASFRGSTASDGRHTATVPAVPGALLFVSLDGYEDLEHRLEIDQLLAGGANELTVVLTHLAQAERSLAGRVVDEIGLPLEGVAVELGHLGTRSDHEGWFHFDLSGGDPFENWLGGARHPTKVTAARAGYLPAEVTAALDGEGHPLWPDPLVLQIAEAARTITGRVVDQNGEPLEGMVVFLPRVRLIASGKTLEGELRGESQFFQSVRSDAGGRFEFGGLLDQDYDLAAFQHDTLVRGEVHGVAAGSTGVELTVDTGDVWPEVRGRVLDSRGVALAGVLVRPSMVTQVARGTTGVWSTDAEMEAVTTGPDGSFRLSAVPRAHVTVELRHPEIMHDDGFELRTAAAVEDAAGLHDVVLHATLRMRFQVVLDDPLEADAFKVLDGAGNGLPHFAQTANSYLSRDTHYVLTEGRSMHLFVADTAETLVLFRAGEETRRAPLALVWRKENVLR